MPRKVLRILKAVLAQGCQYGLVACQRYQAIANVAHCRHVKSAPENASGSAIVGDSHNRCEVKRVTLVIDFGKPLQKNRKTCSAADANDPHRPWPEATTLIVLS